MMALCQYGNALINICLISTPSEPLKAILRLVQYCGGNSLGRAADWETAAAVALLSEGDTGNPRGSASVNSEAKKSGRI